MRLLKPLAFAFLLLACGPAPSPVVKPEASVAVAPAPTNAPAPANDPAADPIAARADEIIAEARAAEPLVTPVLVQVAREHSGEMVKLEHRLKTKSSTIRKLKTRMADKGLALHAVVIDDALRYTIRIDDEPPGRHLDGVKATLAALEADGHRVDRLKNYWPTGDNYSGINCVIRTASGMPWELQFHTKQSLEVQHRTRAWYEELREFGTPAVRKRELFDLMTKAWDAAPIPQHILEPGRVHPKAEILNRPRP
jgi:hypothetical protein